MMLNDVQTVAEKIRQRRTQMIVHSCIYYRLNDSVISDHQWQTWANELRDLQNLFGWEIGYYDSVFKDWDGSSGFHLPIHEPWVISRAIWILNWCT